MPETSDVRRVVADMRKRIAHRDSLEQDAEAWAVVKARLEHALAEVEQAYPTSTHDWVPGQRYDAELGFYRPARFCAECERVEWMPNHELAGEGVRPCSFERAPKTG